MASSSSTVTNIVSALGGPIIEPANIDWATELPAGKRLVEWLASQLSLPTDVDGHALNETEVDFYTRVALNRIALEDEEVRVCVFLFHDQSTIPLLNRFVPLLQVSMAQLIANLSHRTKHLLKCHLNIYRHPGYSAFSASLSSTSVYIYTLNVCILDLMQNTWKMIALIWNPRQNC